MRPAKLKVLLALFMLSLLPASVVSGQGEGIAFDRKATVTPAPSAQPANPNAATPGTMLEYLAMLFREQQGLKRRDRMIQEKLEAVRDESNCMTVEKLMTEIVDLDTSGRLLFLSVDECLRLVHKEPRFLKLVKLKGSTHAVKRAEVIACMRAQLDRYLNELPLVPATNDPYALKGSAMTCARGASILALLLAEYDEGGAALPYVAQLHARSQEAYRSHQNAESSSTVEDHEYAASIEGGVFAAAERILLAKLKHGAVEPGAMYPFDTTLVLEEYGRLESTLDEIARGVEAHFAEVTRDIGEQSELLRIASLSVGDGHDRGE